MLTGAKRFIKPCPVPGKLSKSRRRVSYAEDLQILKELLAYG